MYFTALENEPVQVFVSGYRSPFLMCWVLEFALLCSLQNSELLAPLFRGKGRLGAAFVGCQLCGNLFLQVDCQSR